MRSKNSPALDVVRSCCRVLDDKKAGELQVLDVSHQSSITDYLVLATATSEPHLRALRIELEKALDSAGVRLVGAERVQESGWIVIDAFDVMFHLFLGEVRERYGLARLWRDATEVPLATVLPPPEPAKPKRRASKPRSTKAAPKKKTTPKAAPRRRTKR
jgi:ribosome-associated protein